MAFAQIAFGQKATLPIGAQVYIEPGQSKADISAWFALLKAQGMTVCRIRMDETHFRSGTSYDFSLYDHAFSEAAKNDVQIFATLFPAGPDEKGVGGFKFPKSEKHFEGITEYIKNVVVHFREHPALQAWVLQNEPGSLSPPETDFTLQKFEEWQAARKEAPVYNEYMRKQNLEADFLRDYTSWFLSWIADQVRRYDTKAELHVNNHMIFETLPEYDFPVWQEFLDHLGASMHPSWHFGYFERSEYPLAISANCNIIRTGAGSLPFWVTELQGGNNNFSGYEPLMPSPEEITQWLLTSIFSGAKGIIFWTLNPRSVGFEAGEWGMIDYQNEPTSRLTAAAQVIDLLEEFPALAAAQPVHEDIHILYSKDAMNFQNNSQINSPYSDKGFDARKKGAHIKSVLGVYQAFLSEGLHTHINSLESFDWNKKSGTVILPNMVILPREYYPKLRTFVQNGGKLMVTGQTGHLDEYQYNTLQKGWPLKELFGAQLKEFEMVADRFPINVDGQEMTAHYLKGHIEPGKAKVIAKDEQQNVLGISHTFGKGEVYWIPSMLGLGYWNWPDSSFNEWLKKVATGHTPVFTLKNSMKDQPVFLHHLQAQDKYYTLVVNKSTKVVPIQLRNQKGQQGEIIFQLKNSLWEKGKLTAQPEEVVILEWSNQ
jgi:beta-galactosidase